MKDRRVATVRAVWWDVLVTERWIRADYEGYYASVFYSYFAGLGLDVAVEESMSGAGPRRPAQRGQRPRAEPAAGPGPARRRSGWRCSTCTTGPATCTTPTARGLHPTVCALCVYSHALR